MNNPVRVGCLIIPAIACFLYIVQSGLAGDHYKATKNVLIQPIVPEGKTEVEKETAGLLINNFVLHCSMRIGTFPNDTMGVGFHEQAGNALGQLWYCLEAVKTVKCDYDNVVALTVYLDDIKNLDKFNKRMANFYKEPWPTRTIVEVKNIERDSKVAVSAIAYCGDVIRKPEEYSNEDEY